jgi:hypothetical protein
VLVEPGVGMLGPIATGVAGGGGRFSAGGGGVIPSGCDAFGGSCDSGRGVGVDVDAVAGIGSETTP